MNKLKTSLTTKVIAFILLIIMPLLCAAGCIGIFYNVNTGLYTPYLLYKESALLTEISNYYLNDIYNSYIDPSNNTLRNRHMNQNFNYAFKILDANDNVILANYSYTDEALEGQLQNGDNLYERVYTRSYTREFTYETKFSYETEFTDETTVILEPAPELFDVTLFENIKVQMYLQDKLDAKDFVYYGEIYFNMRYLMIFLTVLFALLAILLLIFMLSAAGHSKKSDDIELNAHDKVPIDLLLAVNAAVSLLLLYFTENGLDGVIIAWFVSFYIQSVVFLMTVATRIKAKTLLKNSVLYYLCRIIMNAAVKLFKVIPTIWLYLVAFILFVFINIIFLGLQFWFGTAVSALICIVILFDYIYSLNLLSRGLNIISAGNLDYKINTRTMFLDIKSISEKLNNLTVTMSTAVDERFKSERFRNELITNVSHDIKTPLTSIINYINLLDSENLENPAAVEYIGVLQKNSQKLKKLTDDIIEASKVSSGIVKVNNMPINITELLNQSIGEYSEKFATCNLQIIKSIPDYDIVINSDGQLLWRVFDNLLNNIYKYALENTRVYMDFHDNKTNCVITMKNISRDPLNISKDDLLERFVRGDTARNTDGSGLGLAIGTSLVTLLNGNLDLEIDGDLFKVILTLYN
jgi:signal transduction histidine kinase